MHIEIGDLIELLEMPNDPDPIPTGTKGIIDRKVDLGEYTQYSVIWENGRSLNIIVPPDKVRVIN